jgi:hypothetical protein
MTKELFGAELIAAADAMRTTLYARRFLLA